MGTPWKLSELMHTQHLPGQCLDAQVCVCSVAHSCPTLRNPVYCSPPGSSVHGVLQARILEGVAMSFSRASSQPRDQIQVSPIIGRLFTV